MPDEGLPLLPVWGCRAVNATTIFVLATLGLVAFIVMAVTRL